MLNLKFAECHTPLFLNGINLGTKLDPTKRAGLYLQYDKKNEFLLVWLHKQLSMVPKETVVNMVAINIEDTGYTHPTFEIKLAEPIQAGQVNSKIVAQVSTPHGHVFSNNPGLTK
jgi:hypothetical protein